MRYIRALGLALGILGATIIYGCHALQSGPARYLPSILNWSEFDSLSRTVDESTLSPLPHVMFLIDRRNGDRIYYINTKRYDWHLTFAHALYLTLEGRDDFFEHNYRSEDRRFIVGNVAWQNDLKAFTWELYEADLASPDILRTTDRAIHRTFWDSTIAYRPVSIQQEAIAATLPTLKRSSQTLLTRVRRYEALHTGEAIGKVHIIDVADNAPDVHRDEIVVLRVTPLDLAPVSGVITAELTTALSHVNLLARSWKIPNLYLQDAVDRLRSYDGKWISLQAKTDTFLVRPASPDEIATAQVRLRERQHLIPRADVTVRAIADLNHQRSKMRNAYGAKSANLGEIIHAELKDVAVPSGFTIPFAFYVEHLHQHGIDSLITRSIRESDFERSRNVRSQILHRIRDSIERAPMNSGLVRLIRESLRRYPENTGFFVRSSTNNEDLAEFSGAGLYTTVANAKGDSSILAAIKTVWGSVWNLAAYDTRESIGVDHSSVAMAVIIQQAINSEASGVMVTTNPYDRDDRGATFISAKRGLGIRVVNGGRVAEQVLYHSDDQAARVLTRSLEDEMLVLDENGGARPIPLPPEAKVLSEGLIEELAKTGEALKDLFGYRNQDIEWAFSAGKLYIIQSRPYLDPK